MDVNKYLLLLYASAVSLLGFAGYTAGKIQDLVAGYGERSLTNYQTLIPKRSDPPDCS
jgi:hypothetical protein